MNDGSAHRLGLHSRLKLGDAGLHYCGSSFAGKAYVMVYGVRNVPRSRTLEFSRQTKFKRQRLST